MLNQNFFNLKEQYLFAEIARKVEMFKEKNPEKKIIRLGIGDVTKPLIPSVIHAMNQAVYEMSEELTFKGYASEQGYLFLREKIKEYYHQKQVSLDEQDIFISDGAKSDLANILDIFSSDTTVLIPNPVYPVYVDTNIMQGRKIIYAYDNHTFKPLPNDKVHADIIYLCSPNNPTGAVYTKEELSQWISYANAHGSVILFDSAYESFISDPSLPTSIYQIEGAKACAIEFCSFSKMAGFTGVRLGYTIVPKELKQQGTSLNQLWARRQTTKFNGVSYIVQKAGEAVFSQQGSAECNENIKYYMENAKIICNTLTKLDIAYTGGTNAPYIWFSCPKGFTSWRFFDYLLENSSIVGTPGIGFGSGGEGYFRFSAFGKREDILLAMDRMNTLKL